MILGGLPLGRGRANANLGLGALKISSPYPLKWSSIFSMEVNDIHSPQKVIYFHY